MQSSVSFPRTRRESVRDNSSWNSGRETRLSVTQRDVALEVHDLVYGEPLTSTDNESILSTLERLYEPNAVYENPLVTATSREMILDIHNFTRLVADVEVARPRALLAWLFGWGRRRNEPPWFEALKCWSEIGDIVAESEGWDGTKRSVIEHNLHILLLPGLHSPASGPPKPHTYTSPSSSRLELTVQPSTSNSSTSLLHALAHPVLSIGGLAVPSPFHLQLRIISKLTFNEQGRISAHRDFWDARDLVGLIPGAAAAQWAFTRLVARSLATANWFLSSRSSRDNNSNHNNIEEAHMPYGTTSTTTIDERLDALGLFGVRIKQTQAPDTDPDSIMNQ